MALFSLDELSNYFGKPAFLVSFTRGNRTWTYTSADRAVTLNDRVYKAVPLTVSAIRQSGDPQSDEVTIEMPAEEDMVVTHITVPPTEYVDVMIARYHKAGDNAVVRFLGQVDRIRRVGSAKAEVKCKTLLATHTRGGARLTWQRGCPHALYDRECKVDKSAYGVTGTVEGTNPTAFVSSALAALADNRFKGGFVEWDFQPAITARRGITQHAGTFAELLGGTYGLEVGMQFTAYPGCPRTAEACEGFYNNLPNYGGIDHLPSKSPFDGNPVF